MKRDEALLLDILLAARDARDFTQDMDGVAFRASRLHQNAVIRSLEVIGEAAGRLSPECRRTLPDIPWAGVIGMRHRLIHNYGDVRLDVVWEVLATDLPSLIEVIERVIPPGSSQDPGRGA